MNCDKCGKPNCLELNTDCESSGDSIIDIGDVSCTVTTSFCMCGSCPGCYFCGGTCVKEIDYNGKKLHLCTLHRDAVKGNLSDCDQFDYIYTETPPNFLIPTTVCNCPLTGPCSCSMRIRL